MSFRDKPASAANANLLPQKREVCILKKIRPNKYKRKWEDYFIEVVAPSSARYHELDIFAHMELNLPKIVRVSAKS